MQNSSFFKFLLDKACVQKVPATGTLELTARCNLSCAMCYIHKKENDPIAIGREKPTEYWLNMIEEARRAGTLVMLITGGEPLLRRDFREIYLACKKAGFLVNVNTNATMITPDDVESFRQYPPMKLNISLYGASTQSYERLCGNGAMYERVTKNIRALCRAGVSVKINYTVTEINHDEASEVYAFAGELGLPVQHTTYMFPDVRALKKCGACRVSAETAAEYLVQCDREKFPPEIFIKRAKACAEGLALEEEQDEDSPRSKRERLFCRAGVSSFWLTYDGRLLPCGMLSTPSLTVDRPFAELWQELKEQTAKIYLPEKCDTCKKRAYCEVCAAACLAETGSFEEVPEYVCKKTDAYLRRMKEIYMEESHEAQ